MKKIVIVGFGMVGTSFLYSALHKKIADEYVIIDLNREVANGHIFDLEDVLGVYKQDVNIKFGDYGDCKGADIIVISAGRPRRKGETRLDMIKDNAVIIKKIANNIKKSGFDSITLIASNPVDLITYIYSKETNFSHSKIISSGCGLDSARFGVELSKKLNIKIKNLNSYVIGEHGDFSVCLFSQIGIELDEDTKKTLQDNVKNKAYEIVKRKGATYYGIGAVLSNICESIIFDLKKEISVGKYLAGEYNEKGIYASLPCVIGKKGIEKSIVLDISQEEIKDFKKSVKRLKEVIEEVGG